jgi:hypothetical protein
MTGQSPFLHDAARRTNVRNEPKLPDAVPGTNDRIEPNPEILFSPHSQVQQWIG